MPRRWTQSSESEQIPLFAAVLAYVRSQAGTGATMEEISLALPARYSSVCPIVHGLAEDGKLRKSGTRLTTANCPAVVYIVAGQVQSGNLIEPTISTKRTPAPRPNRWEQNQQAMLERRRDAQAEAIIRAGFRAGKGDEAIRLDLAAAGLEWPK